MVLMVVSFTLESWFRCSWKCFFHPALITEPSLKNVISSLDLRRTDVCVFGPQIVLVALKKQNMSWLLGNFLFSFALYFYHLLFHLHFPMGFGFNVVINILLLFGAG